MGSLLWEVPSELWTGALPVSGVLGALPGPGVLGALPGPGVLGAHLVLGSLIEQHGEGRQAQACVPLLLSPSAYGCYMSSFFRLPVPQLLCREELWITISSFSL